MVDEVGNPPAILCSSSYNLPMARERRLRPDRLPTSFWKVWGASTASNVGDGIVLAALPLFAAELSRSPVAVAATTVAVNLPWLVFGLFAGAVVDRVDRRRMMIGTDVGRAVAFGLLAAGVATGLVDLPLLYVAVFVIGLLETLFDSAAMSITPSLVPQNQLERANSQLLSAQLAANAFVGPPIGGLLFAIAAALPLGVDALTFLISAMLLISVGGRFRPPARPRTRLISDIGAGLRFLWQQRVIRVFAIGAAVINLGFAAASAVLVLHAQDNLNLGDVGFGLLLASAAVGGVAGAQLASRVIGRLGRRNGILAAVATMAVAIATMGLAGSVWVAGVAYAVFGFAGEVWNVVSITFRQEATPDEMLGRVMSGFRVIAYGAFPVGAALGGVIAELAGLRVTFVFAAVLTAALIPLFAINVGTGDLSTRGGAEGGPSPVL